MPNIETDVEVLKVKQEQNERGLESINKKLDKIMDNELVHLKDGLNRVEFSLNGTQKYMEGIEDNMIERFDNLEKIIGVKEVVQKEEIVRRTKWADEIKATFWKTIIPILTVAALYALFTYLKEVLFR